MKIKICFVILTKDSSISFNKQIETFRDFDEILVIDDYSTNPIELICKQNKIGFYRRHLNGDFSAQRNFALSKAKNDWVLFLDSDEMICRDFIKEVIEKINENNKDGFYIKRDDVFLGHIMSGTEMGNDKVLRLGRKSKGRWLRKVHEYWNIKGRIGILTTPITHNTALNLRLFINKLSFYHKIHSSENENSGKKSSLFKIILFTPLKFVINFIYLKGYQDGVYGFVVSVFMSFHTFLSWSDAWLRTRR